MAITLLMLTFLLTYFHSQPSCCLIACLNISGKNSICKNIVAPSKISYTLIYFYIFIFVYMHVLYELTKDFPCICMPA